MVVRVPVRHVEEIADLGKRQRDGAPRNTFRRAIVFRGLSAAATGCVHRVGPGRWRLGSTRRPLGCTEDACNGPERRDHDESMSAFHRFLPPGTILPAAARKAGQKETPAPATHAGAGARDTSTARTAYARMICLAASMIFGASGRSHVIIPASAGPGTSGNAIFRILVPGTSWATSARTCEPKPPV